MCGPLADEYWNAAIIKVETLEAKIAWEVVDHTEDINVLQITWAFKLKELSRNSKPAFMLEEIKRLNALISLKYMLLLFNGQ